MNTITPQQWGLFEQVTEQAKAYAVLGMKHEAVEELRRVPEDVQQAIPFLVVSLNICVHLELWENAFTAGMALLKHWPKCEGLHKLVEDCLYYASAEHSEVDSPAFDRMVEQYVDYLESRG